MQMHSLKSPDDVINVDTIIIELIQAIINCMSLSSNRPTHVSIRACTSHNNQLVRSLPAEKMRLLH